MVIQVSGNDPAKENLVLSNATSVQDDLCDAKVDIEIVAHGPGISYVNNAMSESRKSRVKARLTLGPERKQVCALLPCANP